ncbi:uncharacterized protein METZ01_LOCUS415990 [marine metagenome]|uniref:Uncharacterized protein n=1 Tax=marine metagenome TaxID=408172 RepID=A0A382WW45_9ZZZZ
MRTIINDYNFKKTFLIILVSFWGDINKGIMVASSLYTGIIMVILITVLPKFKQLVSFGQSCFL